MPYKIEQRAEKWHVVNSETGKDEGGSDSEEMAKKHMAALYAHEPGRKDGLTAVWRYDVLDRLDGASLMANGWLRGDAFISRTGVQEYRDAEGNVRRELRLPEEVFDQDALLSFAMLPLTDNHPPAMLDAENCGKYQRGQLGEMVRRDSDRVRAPVLITDGDLVKKALAGKNQLSCGYTCDLEDAPGNWNGQAYDFIQRRIRGNHVAVVDRARGGPELRLRLDSADAVSIGGDHGKQDSPSAEEQPMTVKIKVDGIEVEVANEQGAQIIEKALQGRSDSLATAERSAKELKAQFDQASSDLTKEKGRADALEATKKDMEKARADAADPKRISEAVRSRIALETQARAVLGEEAKLDEMDDLSVKKAVLAKARPKLTLDGKDKGYIESAYDVVVTDEAERAGRDGLRRARAAGGPPPRGAENTQRGDDADEHLDADQTFAKFQKDTEQAWKKPTVGMSTVNS